jgi:hypothetical protein
MKVRIRETGAVMYENEFRAYIKDIGGPVWGFTTKEILNELGADVVFEGPQAEGGTVYQYSQADGVEEIEGKWYTKYILGPIFTDNEDATAEEQEAEYKAIKDAEFASNARSQRNILLSESDWTQVDDAPVNKTAWAVYRQELRDISSQEGFPISINWPIKP